MYTYLFRNEEASSSIPRKLAFEYEIDLTEEDCRTNMILIFYYCNYMFINILIY